MENACFNGEGCFGSLAELQPDTGSGNYARVFGDGNTGTGSPGESHTESTDHSRLESGQFIGDLEKTDLVALCFDVIQKLSPRADAQQAAIRCIHSHKPIPVSIDALYVEGVLINLIDNALKYAGPEPDVEVEITQDEQEVRLTVSDR